MSIRDLFREALISHSSGSAPKAELKIGSTTVVLTTEQHARNVVGLNEEGRRCIWRIERHLWATFNSPYVDMKLQKGELHLWNFDGFVLVINPENGEVLKKWQAR